MSASAPIPAVVLWLGPTGLTVVRSLGRAGIPVLAAHDNPDDPAVVTRFASVTILPAIEKHEQPWLDFLLQTARRFAPVRPVLFVSSDMHWLLVARHRDLLEPLYRFPFSDSPGFLDWPSKDFQYAIASRVGVPFPRVSAPRNISAVRKLASQLEFPLLVKPTHGHLWRQVYPEKLAFITNPDQLLHRCHDAFDHNLAFILQEYIPAADDQVYSLMSCADADSRLLSACVARKIRQFHPRFGCSSFTTSVHQPHVQDLAHRLIKAIGYRGISSIEFKLDPRDNTFKLMEMNLRPPSVMAAVVDSGFNLPLACYHDLADLDQPAPAPARIGRSVGILAKDLHAFRFNRRMNNLSTVRWLKSWLRARDLYFAWDDMRPFRGYFHMLLDHWKRGVYRDSSWMPSRETWNLGLHTPDPHLPAVAPSSFPAAAPLCDRPLQPLSAGISR